MHQIVVGTLTLYAVGVIAGHVGNAIGWVLFDKLKLNLSPWELALYAALLGYVAWDVLMNGGATFAHPWYAGK
jgi:hypothetical protein